MEVSSQKHAYLQPLCTIKSRFSFYSSNVNGSTDTHLSPIQGSHSGARSSESQAGNCWELLGSAHSGAVGHHMFYLFWGPCCATCGISAPSHGIEPRALHWKLRSVNHEIAREVPSPLSLGGVVSLERIGCEYLGKDWGEAVEAGGQG